MSIFQDIFGGAKKILDEGKEVAKRQLGSSVTYEKGVGITASTGQTPQILGTSRKLLLGERPQERLDRLQTQQRQTFTPQYAFKAVSEDIKREGGAILPSQTQSGIKDIQTIDPFGLMGTTGRVKGSILDTIAKGKGSIKAGDALANFNKTLTRDQLNPKELKVLENFIDFQRGRNLTKDFEPQVLRSEATAIADKLGLKTTGPKLADEFDRVLSEAPVKRGASDIKRPVNKKLEAFNAGKPNLEGGYIASPLGAKPKPKVKPESVSSSNLTTEAKKSVGIRNTTPNRKTNELLESYAKGEEDIKRLEGLQSIVDAQENPTKFASLSKEIESIEVGNRSAIKRLAEHHNLSDFEVIDLITTYIDAGKKRGGRTLKDFYKFLPKEETVAPAPKKVMPIDRLIVENKVRVVSRDGRDVYQVKKGGKWANVRDEDSAIKQASPKIKAVKPKTQLPNELENKLVSIDIAKEALDADPAKELLRYTAKTGQNKGVLQEVTGKAKGKFAKSGDDIASELGFKDSESAREAVLKYQTRKSELVAQEKAVKAEVKDFQRTAKLKEKTVVPAKAVDRVREIQKVAPEQVRSLEEASQQMNEVLDLPPRQRPVALETIVTQATKVDKKVNLLDYIRTPDRVLNKIGFGKEARLLRNQYEKYIIELPKNMDTISEWAKRVPEKGSSERIFNFLDGRDVKLSKTEMEVAGEMRAYLKTWADRLGLPEDKRVTNYITHLFDAELIAKEFDEDLAKIIADKVPGEVYNPFLLERLGAKGFKRDVWGALDAYTKRATRKVHIDPALERIREKAGSSLEFTQLEETQFKYIQEYISRVQQRPTYVDNLIDNGVKTLVGYKLGQRPVVAVSRLLRQFTYRGMLGLNIGSAIRNLSQGINVYAVLGEKYTAIGYAKIFNTSARKELAREGVLASNFIEDRTLSSTKKLIQKADKGLWVFFDAAEKINRSAAYFGAKAQGLSKGMSEEAAVEYAKKIVRKTQFAYDAVDAPVVLGSDLVKTLFQFQTFTTKQTEFLIEMAKDKNFVGLIRYAIAGYVFVNTVGKAMGMEEKELLPFYRFDTPPSLKFPIEVVKAGLSVPDKFGNIPDTEKKLSNVGKASLGLIPGGLQAKKTVQGLESVKEGGVYDKAGRQQFEQGTSKAEQAQSILFGKYASQKAKDYFNKETTTGDKEFDTFLKEEKKAKAEESKLLQEEVSRISNLSGNEAVSAIEELAKTNPDIAEKVLDKVLQKKQEATWDTKEKALSKMTNASKAKYATTQIKKMSNKEAADYIESLVTKGVISENVVDLMFE